MTVEEKREFDRELERIVRLQREGAFGPILDTGGIAPFGLFNKYFGPDSTCPLVGPINGKTPAERVN